MEKLKIVGGQKVSRKISATLVSELMIWSAARHSLAAKRIQKVIEKGNAFSSKFGLTLEHKKRAVNRITALPQIDYASKIEGSTNVSICSANGQWKIGEATKATFHIIKQAHPQHILDIQSGRAVGYTDGLAYALGSYGKKVKRCFDTKHEIKGSTHVKQASAKTMEQLPTSSDIFGTAKPDVLLVLLPGTNPVQFSNIKLWADCVEGIRTVCTVKGRGAICFQHPEQLAMKINHHAGGVNYLSSNVGDGLADCMVVDISVSHPDKNAVLAGGCHSVVSVVANSDKQFLNFPGEIRFQPRRTEVSFTISSLMSELTLQGHLRAQRHDCRVCRKMVIWS